YPLSLLEKNRFPQLTKWLSRLTTCDVSVVAGQEFDSIDDWLDALDAETEVRVSHSSGTTGTMSFLPRSQAEFETWWRLQHLNLFEFLDPESRHDHTGEHMDVIWPTFSRGRSGTHRAVGFFKRYVAGSPERFHPLHDTGVSADVMFLAGRVRRAQARGELDQLEISPKLKARRVEFEAQQKDMAGSFARFFGELVASLAGKRVMLIGQTTLLHDLAKDGLARGLENVFAPGSIVQTGGGRKGLVLPDDWEQTVGRFAGVDRIALTYGMTEINMTSYRCSENRYHMPAWIIPFVLDPETGAPTPRAGSQRGRAAFFDLLSNTYWGGFVSGDEVEIRWSCDCGRTTPNLHNHIQRFSDQKAGDDKITCAAAEEAHQAALDLLTGELV
ncbi:MAG TPA: hypothetical protein VKS60_05400, partial [Stellaceae bacterium]|nr:hypothetical protein [Stellaceae bacterium]